MRRLYSSFAGGWPGVGLVLIRMVAAAVVLWHAGPRLFGGVPVLLGLESWLMAIAAVFLVPGLWTPIAGGMIAVVVLVEILTTREPMVAHLLAATMAIALTMLGPGRLSIDARLFGWKRIELPRKN